MSRGYYECIPTVYRISDKQVCWQELNGTLTPVVYALAAQEFPGKNPFTAMNEYKK